MSDALKIFADTNAIRSLLGRWVRGADRRDKELVRSAYFEDATEEHGSFVGKRDDFIEWWYAQTGRLAKASHVLGNSHIEFASDAIAIVETYFIGTGELADSSSQSLSISFGRYLDRFEKRNGEWRIAHRRVVFDVTQPRPAAGSPSIGIEGRRDPQDPIYLMRAAVGL